MWSEGVGPRETERGRQSERERNCERVWKTGGGRGRLKTESMAAHLLSLGHDPVPHRSVAETACAMRVHMRHNGLKISISRRLGSPTSESHPSSTGQIPSFRGLDRPRLPKIVENHLWENH